MVVGKKRILSVFFSHCFSGSLGSRAPPPPPSSGRPAPAIPNRPGGGAPPMPPGRPQGQALPAPLIPT